MYAIELSDVEIKDSRICFNNLHQKKKSFFFDNSDLIVLSYQILRWDLIIGF